MLTASRLMLIATLLTILSACGGTARAPDTASPDAAIAPPAQDEQPIDGTTFVIDSAASELRVLVFRGGTLARLGHNHVISSRDLRGALVLAEPLTGSRLSMVLPLASLVVDDPALRAEEGSDFPDTVTPSTRDGTRGNMLGEQLLDAARYPEITLEVTAVRGVLPTLNLEVEARIRNTIQQLDLPVTIQTDGTTLTATGQATVTHTQLGLTPFSVMLGALRVEDEMLLKYRIVAAREH